mmetsp:Transcript_20824/g.25029  ORF Transcript_20824/g.25029 Transcript_20824/m.25029 type:complete len:221 (-) Transcript_20824:79-741(-)
MNLPVLPPAGAAAATVDGAETLRHNLLRIAAALQYLYARGMSGILVMKAHGVKNEPGTFWMARKGSDDEVKELADVVEEVLHFAGEASSALVSVHASICGCFKTKQRSNIAGPLAKLLQGKCAEVIFTGYSTFDVKLDAAVEFDGDYFESLAKVNPCFTDMSLPMRVRTISDALWKGQRLAVHQLNGKAMLHIAADSEEKDWIRTRTDVVQAARLYTKYA